MLVVLWGEEGLPRRRNAGARGRAREGGEGVKTPGHEDAQKERMSRNRYTVSPLCFRIVIAFHASVRGIGYVSAFGALG